MRGILLLRNGSAASPFHVHQLARLALAVLTVLLFATPAGVADGAGHRAPVVSKQRSKKKTRRAPKKRHRVGADWSYVLPIDHGIRADSSGRGHFLASRYHGRHNGVDLLAPVGTPVHSACSGRATSGSWKGFGHWVHVVCRLPKALSSNGHSHASLFYAHLSKRAVPRGRWVSVSAGQTLGKVGKSGNASSSKVMPHVHLELIVHGSRKAAMEERHSGRNQTSTPAAKAFLAKLREHCVRPNKLHSRNALNRGRRTDPFVVLSCLGAAKPRFTKPLRALRPWAKRWSSHYRARTFNVDSGRVPAR